MLSVVPVYAGPFQNFCPEFLYDFFVTVSADPLLSSSCLFPRFLDNLISSLMYMPGWLPKSKMLISGSYICWISFLGPGSFSLQEDSWLKIVFWDDSNCIISYEFVFMLISWVLSSSRNLYAFLEEFIIFLLILGCWIFSGSSVWVS